MTDKRQTLASCYSLELIMGEKRFIVQVRGVKTYELFLRH